MYTLDGRMKFESSITASDQQRFQTEKIREIFLTRVAVGFELVVRFADSQQEIAYSEEFPDYVVIESAQANAQTTLMESSPMKKVLIDKTANQGEKA